MLKGIIKKVRSQRWTMKCKRQCKSYGSDLHVNQKTKLSKNCVIGNNVHFNGMIIKGKGVVKIGDNFHSGEDCLMITQNHNYEGEEIPYDSSNIVKDIIIEDNVWIGDRVIILGGITIGEGAIIQAGSVVVDSIPSCAIAGGHPARVFSHRDEKHYYDLKQLKKFH